MHALIIEDDPLTGWLLEEELRELGFTSIDLVAREDDAVRAAATRKPDLITSDGTLAAGNGIGAVTRILERCPVPFIFITGDPEPPLQIWSDAVVVEKPFTGGTLTNAIAQAFAQQGAAQARPGCQAPSRSCVTLEKARGDACASRRRSASATSARQTHAHLLAAACQNASASLAQPSFYR